jgi:hypothetical protein
MQFIIALILAIPTYGLSLVFLFLYNHFRIKRFTKNMEKAIVQLARNQDFNRALIEEILHIDALVYGDEVGKNLTKRGHYVEFTVDIDSFNYTVTVTREPLGKRAIIGSKLNYTDTEEVFERLNAELDALYEAGKISKETYEKRSGDLYYDYYS